MWLTVKEYSDREGITVQATMSRIKKEYIPKDRLRKNDAGRLEIKLRED
jgi:hypothetical protein